jgi:DNA-binding NtrC family response regulator
MKLEIKERQLAVTQRYKVLLVDKSPNDLANDDMLLQGLCLEVCPCMSYADGIKCLETESRDFVLVSQGTCAFEGQCLLERVMEINRYGPVVALTRWYDIPCYLTAMQLGTVDYLEEPLTPRELERVLKTHLRPRTSVQ